MNKKLRKRTRIILIALTGLVIVLTLTIIFIVYPWAKSRIALAKRVAGGQTNNDTTAVENTEELQFSPEQLAGYYRSYENPYVIATRKALNSYLNGGSDSLEREIAVETWRDDQGILYGLDSFDKSYYQSKFIVFAINDYIGGGRMISIIFKDKPDKVFAAWIYDVGDEGNYQMRGFQEDIRFTPDRMKVIQKQYKSYLEDEEHML